METINKFSFMQEQHWLAVKENAIVCWVFLSSIFN